LSSLKPLQIPDSLPIIAFVFIIGKLVKQGAREIGARGAVGEGSVGYALGQPALSPKRFSGYRVAPGARAALERLAEAAI
jgi:hypothetical protein